jgi:cytidylate kinase
MPLVAMTREMGSLGMDVARILERELGVPLVYHEIIENLADKMRLRKSHVVRLLGGKANLFERMSAGEILETAGRGAVLRGWGAAQLLRPVKHAICVRVCAPFDLRVKRIMERSDSDDYDAVAAEIRANDEAQGAITRRHFDVDWQQPENYDLTLNTERMSPEQCADEILWLSKDAHFRETDASRRSLLDLALKARVRGALRADERTRDIRLPVEVENGVIRLLGVVDTRAQCSEVERVVHSVAGDAAVHNQLRVANEIHRPVRE